MHHNLDIKPVPENVIYINEPNFAFPEFYELKSDLGKAQSGLTVKEGGVLPNDNIRVYVPLDLNSDSIMAQVESLYQKFGSPTELNEAAFSSEFSKIINQLEVYDQVWVAQDVENAVQRLDGGTYHSKRGIVLAQRVVDYLRMDEGCAEDFPEECIAELEEEFWL